MKKEFVTKLPVVVECDDYHDFGYIEGFVREMFPEVKIKEIGFAGYYLGIAYYGKLTNPDNAAVVAEIKKRTKEFDSAEDG